MNKLLVKNISLFAGGTLVFLAGLFYVLMTDLKMNNTATWLFIGIILAFGSSIMFLFCESAKEKHVPYFILKGSSILLAIGYVVFLFVFKGSKIVTSINLEDKIAQANAIILISVIIAIIGLVCQLVNLVFSYLLKDEE